MTKSKELVFYSWKPLSPEVSRFSPYTHAQLHTRTSGTFYTFALHRKPIITPSSGPGSRNCPIPPHHKPNHRARPKHGVNRDIPDPHTGLLPTCLGPDRGYFLRGERHPSLFAVLVRGSGPGRADIGLHLHLPV